MTPPEIANGSLSGRVSSYSSAAVIFISFVEPPRRRGRGELQGWCSSHAVLCVLCATAVPHRSQVQEPQLAIVTGKHTLLLELEHARDQSVRRMKHQRMECAGDARAGRRGVFAER